MVLRSGIIIPFQYREAKKLLMIGVPEENRDLSIFDLKNVVRGAFGIYNFEFRNKKIGFSIPDELLLLYLAQRHDLTNFIVEVGQVNDEVDAPQSRDHLSFEPSSSYSQKRKSIEPQVANAYNEYLDNQSDHEQPPPHKRRNLQASSEPQFVHEAIDLVPKTEVDDVFPDTDVEFPNCSSFRGIELEDISMKDFIMKQTEVITKLQDAITKQDEVIFGELAAIKVHLRQFTTEKPIITELHHIFPIPTTAELKLLEEKIPHLDERDLIAIIKKIVEKGGIQKNVHNLLGKEVFLNYNYEGNHGKQPFKTYSLINDLFFRITQLISAPVDTNAEKTSFYAQEMKSENAQISVDEKIEIDEIDLAADNSANFSSTEDALSHDLIRGSEKQLLSLLRKFKMEKICPDLTNAGVTFQCLKYLNTDDIADAIRNIGHRVEFRENLFHWRKLKYGIEDETLGENDFPYSSNVSSANTFRPKFLYNLLMTDLKGKAILQYYEEKSYLTNKQRNELIQIILEDVLRKDIKLKSEHFVSILHEITAVFPNEEGSQDYYFIPRQMNKHAAGKLYSKYFNLKSKNRKLNESPLDNEISDQPQSSETYVEVDKTTSLSLKALLKENSSNWDDITDKWRKTFTLRKEELKMFSNSYFLAEWPQFKDSRAPILINIDFNLLHPGKEHLLKSKWDDFKEKIIKYYDLYIRNQQSRETLMQAKTIKNSDCEDYILTILLNSVILPTARFKNSDGSNKKKISIQDANENFVVKVDCIDDCFEKIDELIRKYYDNNFNMQPFLIVEKSAGDSLKSFYVYFDKVLYKLNSFVESLDLCFKLFHVLNLQYPKMCELPWIFIQKYFYDIQTDFDTKNANITSLLTFMRFLSD